MDDLVGIIKDAGITVIFIAFLIWQVRYFLETLHLWQECQSKLLQGLTENMQIHNEQTKLAFHHIEQMLETIAIRLEVRTIDHGVLKGVK